MAKKPRIALDEWEKMTQEERTKAFMELQGDVRPLGEPFLNKSGGISVRLIEQKPNLKKGQKGWLCFIHLPLHKELASALLEQGVFQAIRDCISDNWQWIGVKEEQRPPGWNTDDEEEPETPKGMRLLGQRPAAKKAVT
jgi:hypothetical protein